MQPRRRVIIKEFRFINHNKQRQKHPTTQTETSPRLADQINIIYSSRKTNAIIVVVVVVDDDDDAVQVECLTPGKLE